MISREIHLKARPKGMPTLDCFELADVDLPAIGDGEVLVKNLWMSVDPYMRGRMDDVPSYMPPFQIGEPLTGGAVGQILESKHPRYQAGEFVQSMMGWREYFIADEALISGKGNPLGGLHKVDGRSMPPQNYLGISGIPGLTAWSGLLKVGKAQGGETVFVSGAAGAVGSTVCQIARVQGCTVVGSAGSDEKVRWLEGTIGADAAFNYKTVSSVSDALDQACPQGIDVYFENVGGEHLSAAIGHMNPFGRIALCGLISRYNAPAQAEEHGLFMDILKKSITVRGFLAPEFFGQFREFVEQMTGWIRDGRLKQHETVLEGIAKAPEAFLGLFSGRNTGKMLVRLAETE